MTLTFPALKRRVGSMGRSATKAEMSIVQAAPEEPNVYSNKIEKMLRAPEERHYVNKYDVAPPELRYYKH